MSDLEEMVRRIVREELAKQAKPANDDVPAEFLSVKEAAAHARVSVYSIRRWRKRGELTKHKAGNRILIRRDELDALLACDIVPIDKNLSIEERVRRRFG